MILLLLLLYFAATTAATTHAILHWEELLLRVNDEYIVIVMIAVIDFSWVWRQWNRPWRVFLRIHHN